jgi:hypothetical protein
MVQSQTLLQSQKLMNTSYVDAKIPYLNTSRVNQQELLPAIQNREGTQQ